MFDKPRKPRRVDFSKRRQIFSLWQQGVTQLAIAKRYGISAPAVHRMIKRELDYRAFPDLRRSVGIK